jgi:hypothetical protein
MDIPATAVNLPAHGRIACAKCFHGAQAEWGRSVLSKAGWRLENNPLAWGGQNPRVMVLGFSKGDRQCAGIRGGAPLDSIPFAGMRSNLTAILRKLGLLDENRTVDQIIATHDPDYHFGSLVRCSIAKLDPSTGKALKAGDIIAAAATDSVGREIASACAEQYLKNLPSRLRNVVLLSNDDAWIDYCFQIVRRLASCQLSQCLRAMHQARTTRNWRRKQSLGRGLISTQPNSD